MLLRTFTIVCIILCLANTVKSQEKIHLHFDKETYVQGDIIYFKAYLLYNSQPSFLSTNFYVAAYTDDGKLLQQKQYPIFESTSFGDISLPDTINSRTLRIRTFTKGMQIADTAYYYERTLHILQQQAAQKIKNSGAKINLQFFAEGGHAVAGLQNVFAIQSLDGMGNPVSVSGTIIEDETTELIDSFYTNENGIGKMQWIPQAGKTYSAVWNDNENKLQKISLPIHPIYGVLLHVEQLKNKLYCNITKNKSDARIKTLSLKAKYGAEEVYSATADFMNTDQWVQKINLDSLPDGILELVLLDAEKNELQRRLFLNEKNTSQPTILILQKNANAKGENTMELEVTDSLQYNLSVAITDINFNEQGNTIKTDLWLSDTMFLNNRAKQILREGDNAQTDILMLTVNQATNTTTPPNYTKPVDNYLSVQALYSKKNYAMPEENKLILLINDTIAGKQFYKLTPKGQTDFYEEGFIFFDSAQFNFRLDKDKEESEYVFLRRYNHFMAAQTIEKQKMEFYEPTSGNPISNPDAEILFENFITRKPKKFNEAQTIKEVVIKSRYKNIETIRLLELDQKYTTGMFSGLARGHQLNVLDDKNAWAQSDVLNYITYRLPGLRIKSINGERFINTRKGDYKLFVFLNEVELLDQEGITDISMTQVAYIKYIPGLVIGSSFVSTNGAVYIYTKKGDEVEGNNNIGMRKMKLKGYDIAQSFTSPDYSDKKNLLNADRRTTLYWNPYLIMDKVNNKVEINFNNNDVSKKLLLTIEGFTEEGKLIHIEKVIEN